MVKVFSALQATPPPYQGSASVQTSVTVTAAVSEMHCCSSSMSKSISHGISTISRTLLSTVSISLIPRRVSQYVPRISTTIGQLGNCAAQI